MDKNIEEINHSFIYLDTIDGIVISSKYLGEDQYPTDYHIDEIFPGFKASRGPGGGIEGLLNFFNDEYYSFKKGEKEWLKLKILTLVEKKKKDIIIDWSNGLRVKIFNRDEIIKKMKGKKFGLAKWKEICEELGKK